MILRAVLPAACLAGLAFLAACDDSRNDLCWSGVDTLYVSGLPVGGESSIEDVFADYVAEVDSTDATFPEDAIQVIYTSSRYEGRWLGVRYWVIRYQAYLPPDDRWYDRELIHIDERGVLVKAYGCF